VLGANGEKLSKQNGAQALDLDQPLSALNAAAQALGLSAAAPKASIPQALQLWQQEWASRWA
jgi:glutamyl-Q tRNA(Asp) synthetase